MSFQIQNQIKRNAQQIRSYVSDLYDWQHEMEIKQKAKNKVLREERAKEEEIKKQLEKQIEEKKKQAAEKGQEQKQATSEKRVDLVRDATTIKDYYTAWDKFNVDQQLTKLQYQQRKAYKPYNPYESSQNYIRAKPKAKVNININNQRAAVIDPTELKDKGNIHFKVCEYEKAIDAYSQCLEKLNQQEVGEKSNKLKSIVLSNRAMAYMKLNENSKAVRDCSQSIRYDATYTKSYLRRGECHKKLGSYLESLADFKKVKELDPNDKDVDGEIKKIEKYLEKLYKEARESLIVHTAGTVVPNSYRIPIQQVEEIEDLSKGRGVGQEKKLNYLEEL